MCRSKIPKGNRKERGVRKVFELMLIWIITIKIVQRLIKDGMIKVCWRKSSGNARQRLKNWIMKTILLLAVRFLVKVLIRRN